MRIISGNQKGRRLRAPKKLPVRPTTDMAKEALFNILSNRFDFDTLKVLDLFSGTGNISYEFCSRGTTSIQAIENDRRCIKFIQETSKLLEMPIEAINSDAFTYLEKTIQKFDLIFADPPYALDQANFSKLVQTIFERKLLKANGICIVEHSKHTNLSFIENFIEVKTYGGNCFSFFE